jgi:hypothetical protein
MRPVVLAGCVLSAAAVVWLPSSASADTTTLYVNQAAATCTDQGPGSADQPYCTAQAAADVVLPGQTVRIQGRVAGPLHISRSGTADAPIVFAGDYQFGHDTNTASGLSFDPAGLVLSGVHDITISGLIVTNGSGPGPTVTVTGSSGVLLDALSLTRQLLVTGGSSAVVLRRSTTSLGVRVDGGASDVTLSTNYLSHIRTPIGPAIEVAGASRTVVVSNTTLGLCDDIDISGGATGTVLENNVFISEPVPAGCTGQGQLTVAADSAGQTTAKYNTFHSNFNNSHPQAYRWADADYTTVASFQAATGQGDHDAIASLGQSVLPSSDAGAGAGVLIDAADAGAPGELATNVYGEPRLDDISVANTGTGPGYYDRGAGEVQDQMRMDAIYTSSTDFPNSSFPSAGTTVYAHDFISGAWGTPVTATFQWGDGQSSTVTVSPLPNGSADLKTSHSYVRPGTYIISVTANDGLKTLADTQPFTTAGSSYIPVAPTRVLDTRTGAGTGGVVRPLGHGGHLLLQLGGVAGIPAGTTVAAVLNVTVTHATSSGYISLVQGDLGPIATQSWSNLNYVKGQTIANLVTTGLQDGEVTVYNTSSGSVDVIADLAGYYLPDAGSGYVPVAPVRILDTRTGNGAPKGPLAGHAATTVQVGGANSIPTEGVTAVAVNLTATDTTAGGYLTGYPAGTTRPTASNVNFAAHQTIANMALLPVDANGRFTVYNGAAGTVDVVADLAGYYTTTGGYHFVSLGGYASFIETRDASTGRVPGPIAAHGTLTFTSPWDVKAWVYNVTVTRTKAPGYITVYPRGATRPLASNLNYAAGQTIAAMAVVPPGTGGDIDFYNGSSGSTDLIASSPGYFN